MNSIFEEEDGMISRRPMISKMLAPITAEVNTAVTVGSIETNLTYQTPGEKTSRKRTVGEALQRLSNVPPPSLVGLPFGIQRQFRKAVMVYTGAYFLAASFIIIDPLDRLEGGLND